MKGQKLLIFNCLIISILIVIRLTVFGWILLALGLVVILPITILYIIVSSKGFKNYSMFLDNDKLILWISFFSYIVFILFQYELDDRAGYMVIEAFIRRYFIGYSNIIYDYSKISIMISIISGLVIIGSDVFLLIRLRKLKQA